MNYGDIHVQIKGPELTDYQEEILYNGKRFTVTEASTKAGKTFSHIWWLFERAHQPWNKEGYNHWWVAPVFGQTKIAFKRLAKKVRNQTGYITSIGNLSITCPNGAVIQFKSAKDPDTLYGEDVYSIVFDEAPRAKVEAHYALRSTITATKGMYKLIGNFGGVSNWVHQLKEKAMDKESEYYYKKITAWDAVEAGILDRMEIIQAQKDLPPNVFAQLYLAEETESEDMLCTYSAINDLWTNTFVSEGQRAIITDIALHGSDKFVISVWSGFRVIYWKEIDKIDADEVTKMIETLAEKYSVPRSRIVYDSDGLGSFLKGYLKGAIPFVNNGKVIGKDNYANIKSQCAFLLAQMINNNEIYFECTISKKEMMAELECLRSYDSDSGGRLRILPKKKIKEIIGHSPDRLDVLIMRMVLEIKPKRSGGLRLARR